MASPVRRLGTLIVDVTIVMIPSISVAVGAAVLALWLTNPEALSAIRAEFRHTPETEATASMARLGQLAPVLVPGEAEGLPPAVAVAVEQGDLLLAGQILSGYRIDFALGTNVVRKPGVIQVRKLDAHPLTVWGSFERFGGYFGSVGTLGIGFRSF